MKRDKDIFSDTVCNNLLVPVNSRAEMSDGADKALCFSERSKFIYACAESVTRVCHSDQALRVFGP